MGLIISWFWYKALNIFKSIEWSKVVLPYCVINKVSTVLTYKWWKNISNSFLEFIKNNNDIFIENDDINKEIDFYMKVNNKISFTDMAVIRIALNYTLDLVTFDKQMISTYQKF